MSHTMEGHEVMLTGAVQLDVPHDDEFLVTEVEGRRQDVLRGHAQAAEDLLVGPRYPGRSVKQPLAIGVLAYGDEQLAHRSLRALPIEGAQRRWLTIEGNRGDLRAHACPSERWTTPSAGEGAGAWPLA